MKKFVKGFTLIELIVAMAIFSILTVAIINMFKPIREVYVDSTLIESRRSAQTGIAKYITESVRYSTDLGIYSTGAGGVTDIKNAAEEFAKAYLAANGVASPTSTDIDSVTKKVEVIVIDNTNKKYTYNGDKYTGRLLRRKFVPVSTGSTDVKPLNSTDYENIAKTESCRMALGAAYYGGSDYTIKLDVSGGKGEIGVSVASTASYGIRDISDGIPGADADPDKLVKTPSFVLCPNLSEIDGLYDISKYNATNATSPGSKVYIVWLNDHKNIPYTYKTGSLEH